MIIRPVEIGVNEKSGATHTPLILPRCLDDAQQAPTRRGSIPARVRYSKSTHFLGLRESFQSFPHNITPIIVVHSREGVFTSAQLSLPTRA